jgi:GntR family transcriptional regulator
MVESPPIPPILFDSRSRRIERDLGEVKGIPRILADQGVTSRTHVIFEGLQAVPRSVAAMIDIPDEVEAISLLRLRFADDQPLSLERMYLDPGRFPGLLDHSPIVSLYELLAQNYGVVVTRVSETIDVVPAERRVCHLLGIRPGSHVVALRRVAYCAAGWPIEASVDLFRADRMRLTVQARIDHAES